MVKFTKIELWISEGRVFLRKQDRKCCDQDMTRSSYEDGR